MFPGTTYRISTLSPEVPLSTQPAENTTARQRRTAAANTKCFFCISLIRSESDINTSDEMYILKTFQNPKQHQS